MPGAMGGQYPDDDPMSNDNAVGIPEPEPEEPAGGDNNGSEDSGNEQSNNENIFERAKRKVKEFRAKRHLAKLVKQILTAKVLPKTLNQQDKDMLKVAENSEDEFLKAEAATVKAAIPIGTTKVAMQDTTATSPSTAILPYVGYIGLALIIFLVILSVIMGFAFSQDEDPKANSAMGVYGDKFYGVRTLYEDENKARVELLEEYYSVINDSVLEIEKQTSATLEGGEAVDVKIDVAIPLLDEDYSFEDFNETEFSTDNANLYELITQIANKVHETDNTVATVSEVSGLLKTLDEIKYFGFNETLNADIKTLVADYIKTHYEFIEEDTGDDATHDHAVKVIDAAVTTVFAKPENLKRTEKLFVKDFIFETKTSYMENIEKMNYKAYIFMAKEQVTMKSFYFQASFADFSSFDMVLTNNGTEVDLNKEKEQGMSSNSPTIYQFKSNANLGLVVSPYNYVELPAENSSLKELFANGGFADLIKESEDGIVSWNYENNSGLVLKFENPQNDKFLCWEFDTLYEGKTPLI